MMVGNPAAVIAVVFASLFAAWAWGMFSFDVPKVYAVTLVFPGWFAYIPGVLFAIGIVVAFYCMT
jgi:uncharacterized membrane protein YedE/YeeE